MPGERQGLLTGGLVPGNRVVLVPDLGGVAAQDPDRLAGGHPGVELNELASTRPGEVRRDPGP